ncbi:MAG TPA: hypothetical protein VFQ27_03660 [Xanthobacteraceae bacterium]|nr:hypothetical protein [Xanthobacteraceae bacterium]
MVSFDVVLFDRANPSFAVVRVPDPVLEDQRMIDAIMAGAVVQLGRPVVLMGAERHETYGREDIRKLLRYFNAARLPWMRTELDI